MNTVGRDEDVVAPDARARSAALPTASRLSGAVNKPLAPAATSHKRFRIVAMLLRDAARLRTAPT